MLLMHIIGMSSPRRCGIIRAKAKFFEWFASRIHESAARKNLSLFQALR